MIEPLFRYRLFSLLPRISLFGALRKTEVDLFTRRLRVQKLEAGEALFREGDSPRDFYLLLEGGIELRARGRRITSLQEGELLGTEGPIGIQAQSFTATAHKASAVLVIPPRSLHRLSKENPATFGLLMSNIARDFARRLHSLSRIVADRPRSALPGRPKPSRPAKPLPLPGDRGTGDPPPDSWPRLGRELW